MPVFHTAQRPSRCRTALVLSGVLGGAALLAGCGGSGSSTTNSPQIRAVNAISNGGRGTISVNGTAISGGQTFFQTTDYQSLGNPASSVTFSLNVNPNTTYPAFTQSFQIGSYYSLILVGRADITDTTDPRYPSVLVTSDTFTTFSTGQAEVRIIHAAPDAGSVDVLVNGAAAVNAAAYKSVSSDIVEPAGSVTIQVNKAGASTALVTAQTVSLTAGHVYTVFVLEPTVSGTPTYSIQETDDTATAYLLN